MVLAASTHVMLYMSAQNELSDKATENIHAIEKAVRLDNICTYIMLDKVTDPDVDGRDARNTLQYFLAPGAAETPFASQGFATKDENVSDPEVFEQILGIANEHFQSHSAGETPLQKLLIFWGHGGGLVMLDEQQKAGVQRAGANMKAFADVLVTSSKASQQTTFDIIAFDSCYMCMIETLHELRSVSKFALCSSTMVDADGFPYEKMFNELKVNGQKLGPSATVERLTQIYDVHYLEKFPKGDRFLFICNMEEIAECVTALNAFGIVLTSLLSDIVEADPVRDAINEALIAAHADSSYVYVLRFLRMLPIMLDGRITQNQMTKVEQQSKTLRSAVKTAFQGNMGDTTENFISPLIWVPSNINAFANKEANYNELQASNSGSAGWATFWRTFHGRSEIAIATASDRHTNIPGLPTTKTLAL